jgi:hypothetical protein
MDARFWHVRDVTPAATRAAAIKGAADIPARSLLPCNFTSGLTMVIPLLSTGNRLAAGPDRSVLDMDWFTGLSSPRKERTFSSKTCVLRFPSADSRTFSTKSLALTTARYASSMPVMVGSGALLNNSRLAVVPEYVLTHN